MLRWYLVHTKQSSETLARANLERQGYAVYFPRLMQPARRCGRWQERIVPLFPGYMFLHLSEGCQPLAPVRSSIGVSSVVRFGSNYAVVPDQVVRDLQARADPQSGLHRMSRPPLLTSGTGVKITMGPFGGLEGIFEREAGAERVIVLLKLLGRDTSVRVPARFVIPSQVA